MTWGDYRCEYCEKDFDQCKACEQREIDEEPCWIAERKRDKYIPRIHCGMKTVNIKMDHCAVCGYTQHY